MQSSGVHKMQSCVDSVLASIQANDRCQGGVAMNPFVVASEKGPSGGAELAAFIHAASATGNWPVYWYGHVLEHPAKPGIFASSLLKSKAVVNGSCAAALLERFHFWIDRHGKWSPSCYQDPGDTYRESADFFDAVHALTGIIDAFDEARRAPTWDIPELGESENEWSGSPCDMRPWSIYCRNPEHRCRVLEGEELIESTIIPPDRCAALRRTSNKLGAHVWLAGAKCIPKAADSCHLHVSALRCQETS